MRSNFKEKEYKSSQVKITKFSNGKEVSTSSINIIDKPKKKFKANKSKRKKKKTRFKQSKKSMEFYRSREWLELRYRVLRIYKAKCMCCGRTPQEHGITVHVDHIKPRSKYPKLELDLENMQVLCAACNFGKSNIDNTDWRALTNNDIFLIKMSDKMG